MENRREREREETGGCEGGCEREREGRVGERAGGEREEGERKGEGRRGRKRGLGNGKQEASRHTAQPDSQLQPAYQPENKPRSVREIR